MIIFSLIIILVCIISWKQTKILCISLFEVMHASLHCKLTRLSVQHFKVRLVTIYQENHLDVVLVK